MPKSIEWVKFGGSFYNEAPMLDIRKIRENPEFYREETRKKGSQ